MCCSILHSIPFHCCWEVCSKICVSLDGTHTHTRKHIAAEHKKSQEKTKRTHKSVHSYIELKENHIVFYCCCCIIALYSGVWCVARLARCFIRRSWKKSTISAICLELPNRLRAPLRFCCIYISFIAGVLKPCLDILKFYLTIDDIDWILFWFRFFRVFFLLSFGWLFIVIAGDISSIFFLHFVGGVAVVIFFFLYFLFFCSASALHNHRIYNI